MNKDFQLTEFSFYKSLERVHSLEKQKSYARFFRKFLKKLAGIVKENLTEAVSKTIYFADCRICKVKKRYLYIGRTKRTVS